MDAMASRDRSGIKFTDELERDMARHESAGQFAPPISTLGALAQWGAAVMAGLGGFALLAKLSA